MNIKKLNEEIEKILNEDWNTIKKDPRYIGDEELAKRIVSNAKPEGSIKKVISINITGPLTMSSHGNIRTGKEYEVHINYIGNDEEQYRDIDIYSEDDLLNK